MKTRLLRILPPLVTSIVVLTSGCGDPDEDLSPNESTAETEQPPPAASQGVTETSTPLITSTGSSPSTPTQISGTERLTHTDPMFGYSFAVPVGWYLSPTDANIGGYAAVTTYDPATAPDYGDISDAGGDIKIEVTVKPNPDSLSPELWASRFLAGAEAGITVISEESHPVDSYPAVRRVTSDGSLQTTSYVIHAGDRMYVVFAYNTGNGETNVADDFVAGLRIPR